MSKGRNEPLIIQTTDGTGNNSIIAGQFSPKVVAESVLPSTKSTKATSSAKLGIIDVDQHHDGLSEVSSGSGASDVEDYDTQQRDTSAIIETSPTVSFSNPASPEKKPSLEKPFMVRRNSIPVRLEKTSQKGRYIVTLDDDEIRNILRAVEDRAATTTSSNKRNTLRELVFTRRFSTFDRQSTASAESPFRGFFTLFWLSMFLMIFKIAAQNWRIYGSILGTNEVMKLMFGRDVIVLFITDGIMCFATAFGWLLHRLILANYLSWNRSGWIIQSIWQLIYLVSIIAWTMYRDWPWTHTIFIVLHALVFLMKQHSYTFYNGHLSQLYRRKIMLEKQLSQLKMISPLESPALIRRSTSAFISSSENPSIYDSVLRRRGSHDDKRQSSLASESSQLASVAASITSGKPLDTDQLKAFNSLITDEIKALNEELKGKCSLTDNHYPKNLTLSNFAIWTTFPTLVYELEYPRQEKINWWYVAEKTAATFGGIGIMMVVSQAYIYPLVAETVRMKEAGMSLQERWNEFPWVVSDMLFPLLLEQLLVWYVIWECVLNVLAELTRFADRGFYSDFWNCTSWDQYSRRWNTPVHNFLLRHVYHSSISAFQLSRMSATFVTFFLSACIHELLMYCLFKKVRGYLFTLQLMQIPLAALSRTKLLKGRDILGNAIFWFGLFVGPSMISCLYLIV